MTLVELKAKASELGLTPDEVRQHGSLAKKATWEAAIAEFEQWKESVVECAVNYTPQDENPYVLSYLPSETEEENAIAQSQENTENIAVQRNEEKAQCPVCSGNGWLYDDNTESGDRVCDTCGGKKTLTLTEYQDWEEYENSDEVLMMQSNAVQRYTDNELPFEPTQTFINGKWVKIDGEWVKTENSNPPSSGIRPFRPVLTEICKPDNSGYLVWSDKFKRWVKEKPSESSTPIRDKLFAKMMGYVGTALSLSDLEEMQKESPDEKTAAIYLAILEESERLLIEAVAA